MKRYPITDRNEYTRNQLSRSRKKWTSPPFFTIHLRFFQHMMQNVATLTKNVKTICCMGIRNGNEYLAFRDVDPTMDSYRDAVIYGVDICEKVVDVGPNCFCHDFSKLPADWESKFDMVYSNSLDHAFDVPEALNEWHRVVRPGGYMVLELSRAQENGGDMHSFEFEDIDRLDKKRFEVMRKWENQGGDFFSVLLKIIK